MNESFIGETLKKIDEQLNKVKEKSSAFYKKLGNEDNQELINLYKEIVKSLKYIIDESRKLDSIEVPKEVFESDKILDKREANCNIIQTLSQHIRGCIASFNKYNEILKKYQIEEKIDSNNFNINNCINIKNV